MADDVVWQLAPIVAGLFAGGAVVLLVLAALGRGRGLWVAFVVEPLLAAAFLVPVYLGPTTTLAALAAIALLATRELVRAVRLTGVEPEERVALAAAAALVGAAVLLGPGGFTSVAAVCLTLALAVPLLRGRGPTAGGATLLGAVYPALGLATLGLVAAGPNGFGRVLMLYAMVEMNDVAALLVGKLLGRHRLWPNISPNKTIEGTVAGVLASLAAALLFAVAVPEMGLAQRLLLGLVVGFAVPVGDLVASAIKRAAGVKDYGTMVPGSGGVLDVCDSLAFAAPFFCLLVI